MSNKLYTYALIRCLYNEGEDYIDSFWPLIVTVLPNEKKALTLQHIQAEIGKKYNLLVPIHSLQVIAKRATDKGYIERKSKKFLLTDEGISYVSNLETEREAQRRINELLDEGQKYISANHKINFSREQIQNFLEKFIKENIDLFEPLLNPLNNNVEIESKFSRNDEAALIEYFRYIESSKPTIFTTFKDIVFGSIISTIVYSNRINEAQNKFETIKIFFDTNFLLNLFGFGFEDEKQPAQELFKLLKLNKNFDFRIFDFTIEEITNVLKNYGKEINYYFDEIKINSLYSSMKAQGWTPAGVKEFIVNIEKKLWGLNIEIFPSSIDLKKFEPEKIERRSAINNYKPDQGEKEQNHDLAAIQCINKIRQGHFKKIESCQAMFLTSDLKLAKFNYIEDNHKNKETICEVIPDRLLTNLLWLKNPSTDSDAHLSSIISMHSRQLYVDKKVWKSFYKNLTFLREKGDINDFDVSILIYDKVIHKILVEKRPEEIDLFESDWIIENIEHAKARLEKTQNNMLEEQKNNYKARILAKEIALKNLEFALSSQKRIIDQVKSEYQERFLKFEQRLAEIQEDNTSREESLINTILSWKNRQKNLAQKITNRWISLISILSSLIMFFTGVISVRPLIRNWNIIDPLVSILPIILSLLFIIAGIKLEPFKWRVKLKERIFKHVLKNKLQGLENV